MTPKEAAHVIGCSPSHVRHLIRVREIEAIKYHDPMGNTAYFISVKEAKRYRDTEQPSGWPRGQSR